MNLCVCIFVCLCVCFIKTKLGDGGQKRLEKSSSGSPRRDYRIKIDGFNANVGGGGGGTQGGSDKGGSATANLEPVSPTGSVETASEWGGSQARQYQETEEYRKLSPEEKKKYVRFFFPYILTLIFIGVVFLFCVCVCV